MAAKKKEIKVKNEKQPFIGMLPNGKPLLCTMYYERYYHFPEDLVLLERDCEEIKREGWTATYSDYTGYIFTEVWKRWFDICSKMDIYHTANQWNVRPWLDEDLKSLYSNVPQAVDETGKKTDPKWRPYGHPAFQRMFVAHWKRFLDAYIKHPGMLRIWDIDGKFHPFIFLIYEVMMCTYGNWLISYDDDTLRHWHEWQSEKYGEVKFVEAPTCENKISDEAWLLWNEFRAEYLVEAWTKIREKLKEEYPDLYCGICFAQHGLIENRGNGRANNPGIGLRGIRPELWRGKFDVYVSEHDGENTGISGICAEADLMRCMAQNKLYGVIPYLNTGRGAWWIWRPRQYVRNWTQLEILGSLSIRRALIFHYGVNERDDGAGIMSQGPRGPNQPLFMPETCEEVSKANHIYHEVAPYVMRAKLTPRHVGILLPYSGYIAHMAEGRTDNEMDIYIMSIYDFFFDRNIQVDWLFERDLSLERRGDLKDYDYVVLPDTGLPLDLKLVNSVSTYIEEGGKVILSERWTGSKCFSLLTDRTRDINVKERRVIRWPELRSRNLSHLLSLIHI